MTAKEWAKVAVQIAGMVALVLTVYLFLALAT